MVNRRIAFETPIEISLDKGNMVWVKGHPLSHGTVAQAAQVVRGLFEKGMSGPINVYWTNSYAKPAVMERRVNQIAELLGMTAGKIEKRFIKGYEMAGGKIVLSRANQVARVFKESAVSDYLEKKGDQYRLNGKGPWRNEGGMDRYLTFEHYETQEFKHGKKVLPVRENGTEVEIWELSGMGHTVKKASSVSRVQVAHELLRIAKGLVAGSSDPKAVFDFANQFVVFCNAALDVNLPSKSDMSTWKSKFLPELVSRWDLMVKENKEEIEKWPGDFKPLTEEDRIDHADDMFLSLCKKHVDFWSIKRGLREDEDEYFNDHPNVESSDEMDNFSDAKRFVDALVQSGDSLFEVSTKGKSILMYLKVLSKMRSTYVGKGSEMRDELAKYGGLLWACALFLKGDAK